MITAHAIVEIRKAGLAPSLIRYFFNNPDTYVLLGRGGTVPPGLPRAVPVEDFTSYAAMERALPTGSIYPHTRAILYDNESWDLTPPDEQAHPVLFAARAERLVHRSGLKFIFAPATDLFAGGANRPRAGTSRFWQYLAHRMAARGVRVSDVFEIQAQGAEATSEFVPFVTRAVAQARRARAGAVVLAGLSTNPEGRRVTARDLLTSYWSARASVSGFWLNVPPTGPDCANCGSDLAVTFLRTLARRLQR